MGVGCWTLCYRLANPNPVTLTLHRVRVRVNPNPGLLKWFAPPPRRCLKSLVFEGKVSLHALHWSEGAPKAAADGTAGGRTDAIGS